MFTFGSDFQYENARLNYDNMDKLIYYTNMKVRREGGRGMERGEGGSLGRVEGEQERWEFWEIGGREEGEKEFRESGGRAGKAMAEYREEGGDE